MKDIILDIKNLTVTFENESGLIKAVDDVSLPVRSSEILGLVGESGCGKSTTALSILRLIPSPPGKISGGGIFWKGTDLSGIPPEKMRKVRGAEISMIFQEPLTSFNPVQKIGKQVEEALLIHRKAEDSRSLVIEMLEKTGLKNPARVYGSYPHELSGGMRQRAMIAMALICGPELLIADEPTTALDVTIQAGILDLLKKLQKDTGMSVLLITHNLGIIAGTADSVAVMYAGKMIEYSPVADLFGHPLHPYTAALLKSVPNPGNKGALYAIPGTIPDLSDLPSGCTFHPRCEHAMKICSKQFPPTKEVENGLSTACWLYLEHS